ncbi:MAG TPA: sigma-70 family RNA polymerase sigma factor [Anaerolineaceae bacterium]|nr:sigma-70 family RNA polymerase sigma factor [Anaerolineaceae bacterium]
MDEIGLIQDAKHGDLNAFNRLVLAYQEIAYNVAYRMLNDPDAAEDATQTAFISAYKNLDTYRGGSFRAWVLRMVTNTCYDELRRRKRRPTVALEPVDEESNEEIESPSWLADDEPGPEDTIENRELETAIQRCIQNLPEEFRTAIVLIDVQGLDYQEASEITHTPLGTVKSRLARARLRMRDCLQGIGELLPSSFRLGDEGSL